MPKERPERFTVNITRDGTIYSGSQVVTLDQLRDIVKSTKDSMPEMKLYLRADQETAHRHVKKVMNIMGEVGVDDFIFGAFIPDN